jgi:hypothetical protein
LKIVASSSSNMPATAWRASDVIEIVIMAKPRAAHRAIVQPP